MTELRGTFDAAKADWSKLFGEAPKSIDDIDVIGLHDKTIDKKREFVAIDRVLEIIDELKRMEDELEERANSIGFVNYPPTGSVKAVEHLVMPRNPNEIKVVKLNAKADGIQYAREYLKSAVLALKGGEQ